jgi:hypothetical protein
MPSALNLPGMRIRYAPARGVQEVELRDIHGGSALAKWIAGEERDVSGTVSFVQLGGVIADLNAAQAVFRHGPDFVDAATGKNPLFTCMACGDPALEQYLVIWTPDGPEKVSFQTDAGEPLCMADFLAANPDYIVPFRFRGVGNDVLAKAQSIITQRSQAPAPAAPVRGTTAADESHEQE